ncbi:hypothetical protein CTAYLR_008448 [Chrysophaeum taylorii]|uniref:Alpha N-terminal protein methyltransferase 1 n=1 Tax=Chrysophaeum taylorii TaxID=2483200 RepID=A0AAD7UMB0_9STRA|nr:hypothetical protein CTAYLR_008448 [Chrysophaeum taylorii]
MSQFLVDRIEKRLVDRGCRLSGSSDAQFWASPKALWQDKAYRESWYSVAKQYWEDAVIAPPTLNGVLGGFAHLDAPDSAFSRRFLRDAKIRPGFVAADMAAGIGRVCKHVLLPSGASRVDVVEQSTSLLRAAPDYVAQPDELGGGEECAAQCRFVRAAMQEWRPAATYDVVWVQWSVGHLTDVDFVAFLVRCRDALAPNGIVVVKDNVLHTKCSDDDAFYVDDDDRSICRSLAYYRSVFDEAEAQVILERKQPVEPANDAFPNDIYPVFAWALAWNDDARGEPPRLIFEEADDVEPPHLDRPHTPDSLLRGLGSPPVY